MKGLAQIFNFIKKNIYSIKHIKYVYYSSKKSEIGNEITATIPFHLEAKIPNLDKCKPFYKPKLWFDEKDPRLLKVKLFLPTIYEDPIYLNKEVLWVYRHLLRWSNRFPDDRARLYLLEKIKSKYRKYQNHEINSFINKKRAKARKHLRQLIKAIRLDSESLDTILFNVYGRRGEVRWDLIRPYLPPSHLLYGKYHPSKPFETPLHPNLSQLAKLQKLKLTPPPNLLVQHSKVRNFNLYHRHTVKVLEKLQPPIPSNILNELFDKSTVAYWWQNKDRLYIQRDQSRSKTNCRRMARAYTRLLEAIPKIDWWDDENNQSKIDIEKFGILRLPKVNEFDRMGL